MKKRSLAETMQNNPGLTSLARGTLFNLAVKNTWGTDTISVLAECLLRLCGDNVAITILDRHTPRTSGHVNINIDVGHVMWNNSKLWFWISYLTHNNSIEIEPYIITVHYNSPLVLCHVCMLQGVCAIGDMIGATALAPPWHQAQVTLSRADIMLL